MLDEPNANLDEAGEQALLAAIARLRACGRTLVLITHKPALIAGADQLLVLRVGRCRPSGRRPGAAGPAARRPARADRPQPAPALRVAPTISMSYGSPGN